MSSSRWVWETTSRRYRDVESGRWLSHGTVTGLRNAFAAEQRTWADVAAAALGRRDWTVRRWELEVRDRLKRVYLGEYLLGRGGKQAMTAADYGRVGAMLRDQYAYLRGFALEVQAGTLSEAQVAARTQLYHANAVQAFERGKAAAYGGDLVLPAYPGDAGLVCACKCHWRITETKRAWKAYWRVSARAESCSTCLDRAARYNPYTQAKVAATAADGPHYNGYRPGGGDAARRDGPVHRVRDGDEHGSRRRARPGQVRGLSRLRRAGLPAGPGAAGPEPARRADRPLRPRPAPRAPVVTR
jgi:hypothetical protein